MSEGLARLILELKNEEAEGAIKSRMENGEDPLRILDECRKGMVEVGDLFQKGDYFLAELMLSAEVFKSAVAILEPYLAEVRPPEPIGKVVLATLKGDIHDLGKNLFATLLRAQGFEVIDMGVDVDPALVIKKVREARPHFVGFSVLISTAFDSMKQASEMFAEEGIRDQFKLMVGGGVTTPAFKDYIGADFQSLDAAEGVAYCSREIKGA